MFSFRWNAHPDESGQKRFAYIDAFEGGRQMTYQGVRERMPHMVSGDEDMRASPGECVRRMLRNLVSIGASRSNNMRDGSYSLLRCALELMMEVNTTDTMQYAFMLSRIYLQLNINQHEVRALLADQLNPGLADQVEYLMHQCQLQLEEKLGPAHELRAESHLENELHLELEQESEAKLDLESDLQLELKENVRHLNCHQLRLPV